MNFIERVKYAFTNELTETQKSEIVSETIGTNPSIGELEAFFGRSISAEGSRLNSATYYSCIQIRCNSFAKLPLKLMKWNNGGSVKAENHSLYNLLRIRPNKFMTPHDLLWATEFMRLHYGNAFWVPQFERGQITSIQLLDSYRVQIMIDETGLLDKPNSVYYIYNDEKKGMLIYNSEDICHFKNFALNGVRGTSISKYIYRTIENEQLSQGLLHEKYSSGLQDPVIVQYAGDLGDALQNKIKKKFAELGGPKNAGRVVPIPTEFKVEQLETKLVNNQFFELQGLTTRQIANAFGIKSFQLNDMEKSTYNNVEQQNKAYYSDTLQNVLTSYEQEMNYKLLTKTERQNYFWKINVDSVLRSDLSARMASYSTGVTTGFMTIAEVREKEDLPFVEGTDKLIFGNGAAVYLEDIGKWKGGEINE